MGETQKSNTGIIIAVIIVVVVVIPLLLVCACLFCNFGIGGCAATGPGISDVFSNINSALQATPVR